MSGFVADAFLAVHARWERGVRPVIKSFNDDWYNAVLTKIDSGMVPTTRDLFFAATHNCDLCMVQLLLARGASPSQLTVGEVNSIACIASDVVFDALVSAGAPIDWDTAFWRSLRPK